MRKGRSIDNCSFFDFSDFFKPYDGSWTVFDNIVKKLSQDNNLTTHTVMYRFDDDDNLLYEFVLPGYEKEEIEITYDTGNTGNFIKVKAKNEKKNYDSSFLIKDDYNPEPISAKLRNGILIITFKKAEIVSTAKKVKID